MHSFCGGMTLVKNPISGETRTLYFFTVCISVIPIRNLLKFLNLWWWNYVFSWNIFLEKLINGAVQGIKKLVDLRQFWTGSNGSGILMHNIISNIFWRKAKKLQKVGISLNLRINWISKIWKMKKKWWTFPNHTCAYMR